MPDLLRQPPNLPQALAALLAQIPPGRVTTYGDLARALGDVAAARWVGRFLRQHQHKSACACHRVVLASGGLGGYGAGGADEKARRLKRDGAAVRDGRVDLAAHGFDRFEGERPLERLRDVQAELLARRRDDTIAGDIRKVAGLDVSYADEFTGVGAIAVVDLASGRLESSATRRRVTRFPYVPSYLAFRELPVHLDLLERADDVPPPDLLMLDGAGAMHPRAAGIATLLGIAAGLPTIGVTKKLLFGSVDTRGMSRGEARPVTAGDSLLGDSLLGYALRRDAASQRPLYVSPGHAIDADGALAIVRRTLLGRALPEPIYWADRLSRAAARGSGPP